MPESENKVTQETSIEERKLAIEADLSDPITLVERVYQIWWHWADFHIYIVSPHIETITPALIIPPAAIPGTEEYEFVYDIHDHGSKLSTSKGAEMYTAGMSMCKLFFTIEKMIFILMERLKAGGVSAEAEVQVAFGGHELAQRKAFESIINLSYNVVVTNFDPGSWGERYLQSVKRIADKGYGYPPESPRETFRQSHSSIASGKSR